MLRPAAWRTPENPWRLAPMAALLATVALGGCGSSGTKTVSVSSAPASSSTAQSTQSTRSSPTDTSSTTTSTTPTQSTGETGGVQATRTAPSPAFTKQSGQSESSEGDLAQALAVVKEHGYSAASSSEYHSGQTLRVLVGTRSGSADGYGQQAFFFLGGHYLGTDTSQPSASVKVLSQSDTEVTLAYPLYRPHDPLCCPGAGQARVRFQLDNGKLTPLDPIPPAASQTGTSRQ